MLVTASTVATVTRYVAMRSWVFAPRAAARAPAVRCPRDPCPRPCPPRSPRMSATAPALPRRAGADRRAADRLRSWSAAAATAGSAALLAISRWPRRCACGT